MLSDYWLAHTSGCLDWMSVVVVPPLSKKSCSDWSVACKLNFVFDNTLRRYDIFILTGIQHFKGITIYSDVVLFRYSLGLMVYLGSRIF